MRAAAYLAALAIGLVALPALLPLGAITGGGDVWRAPPADLAQNLTGHIALQLGAWGWPLLHSPVLGWPDGASIAMTDSNPLASLLAKVLAAALGRPVNLFAPFLALCWLLQPVAAVYAVRGFGARAPETAIAAAALALLFPALIDRMEHINLCAHFLILAALGQCGRMMRGVAPVGWREWRAPMGLALVAALVHPHLFLFSVALFAAPALQRAITPPREPSLAAGGLAAVAIVPLAMFIVLSGSVGGANFGFGFFSMNLASPVWPQRSGLFGADLPVLDATGGQYEGFNYLGAGILLLALVAAGCARRLAWRRWLPLGAVLLGLVAIALSNRVFLGDIKLVALESSRLEGLMAPIRASGRAFWPVGYTVLLAALIIAERRLPRPALRGVLALAVALQLADTAPLRADLWRYWQGEIVPPPILSLRDGRMLGTANTCALQSRHEAGIDRVRLAAIRAGMVLGEMRLSRSTPGTSCEILNSDAFDLALRDGELRAFVGDAAIVGFRRAALGDAVRCDARPGMIMCRPADTPTDNPTDSPTGPPLAAVQAPAVGLAAAALRPLLSWGWHEDGEAMFWSSGPRATLLFRLDGPATRLRLVVEGIARRPGGSAGIRVAAGANRYGADAAVVSATLRDLEPGVVEVALPAGTGEVVRVVIDIAEPVDRRIRTMAMPVRWGGLRLRALDVLGDARH